MFVFLLTLQANAQLWSGVLAKSRATDWSSVGANPNLKSNRDALHAVCQTISAGASAAAINTAINNCAAAHPLGKDAGGVVVLSAGNYTLTAPILLKSNVTLRGAGANQTRISMTTGFAADGIPFAYAIGVQGTWHYISPSHAACMGHGDINGCGSESVKRAAWTGTNGKTGMYTQGATVLNLASPLHGLATGMMLYLYQTDDPGPTSGYFTCGLPTCCRDGGKPDGQFQAVKVEGIHGSTITISLPGIYMPTWTSSKGPQAYYWGGDTRAVGIEDLFISTGSASAVGAVIAVGMSQDVWVSGVGIQQSGARNHIGISGSRAVTVRSSYFKDSCANGCHGTSTGYGVSPFHSSHLLIENNIFDNVQSPITPGQLNSGIVYAYNFDAGNFSGPGVQTGLTFHENANLMSLIEGNDLYQLRFDAFHGPADFNTVFRTYLRSPGDTAFDDWTYSRYNTIVGSVVGSAGATGRYECDAATTKGTVCDGFKSHIFRLGYSCHGCNGSGGVCCEGLVADGEVKSSLVRWGNWDPITNNVRWCKSGSPSPCTGDETGSAAITYPGLANPGRTLPGSFYLSRKPAWFGKVAWPPIGPDVTGGNLAHAGGHANKIPARTCYESISGNLVNFNAATCYGSQMKER